MGASAKRRTRKHRRRAHQKFTFSGWQIKPPHRLQSGRTGAVHSKRTVPKHNGRGVVTSIPWSTPSGIRMREVSR